MERNINFTYIGGLFLIFVVAMVGFVIWMGGGDLDRSKYRTYHIYSSEGMNGVGVGTAVRYKGIVVGKVKSLGFKDGDMGMIKLDVGIDSKLKILKNACVSVESQGLVGGSHLELKQGEGEELPDGSDLCYQEGFMGKLLDNIEKGGGDAREIIAEIKELFTNENGQNIREIITSLRMITKNLEQTRQNIDKLSISANEMLKSINQGLERGDYNVRQVIAPAVLGVESSLAEMKRFFGKANLLLDRLEKSPYEAIFGQREEEKKK